jgi:hypothetical protein
MGNRLLRHAVALDRFARRVCFRTYVENPRWFRHSPVEPKQVVKGIATLPGIHATRCPFETTSMHDHTDQIIAFLGQIGIRVVDGDVAPTAFLPGIDVVNGGLVIDRAQLIHPGDLLHEAGHIAVLEPERRACASGTVEGGGAEEMAAIAWSWAALLHLSLPPDVVFHAEGYRGGAQSIIENFTDGRFFGVPWLAYCGLTRERYDPTCPEAAVFPKMQRWLRA